MFPKETEIAFWDCPECDHEEFLILVSNLAMEDTLICSDCGNESGPMEWAETHYEREE